MIHCIHIHVYTSRWSQATASAGAILSLDRSATLDLGEFDGRLHDGPLHLLRVGHRQTSFLALGRSEDIGHAAQVLVHLLDPGNKSQPFSRTWIVIPREGESGGTHLTGFILRSVAIFAISVLHPSTAR